VFATREAAIFSLVASEENSIVSARLPSALIAVESFVLLLVVLYLHSTTATTFVLASTPLST
jgi:hypothetical protein